MALFTYLFAFFHFGSEIFIYRTAKIAPPVLSPIAVAGKSRTKVLCYRYLILLSCGYRPRTYPFLSFPGSSLIWMLTQYDFYVKA